MANIVASSFSNDPLVAKVIIDLVEFKKLKEASEFRDAHFKKEQTLAANNLIKIESSGHDAQVGFGTSEDNDADAADVKDSLSNEQLNELKSFLVDNLRSEVKLAVKEAFREQRHLLIPLGDRKDKKTAALLKTKVIT